jgi:hypothetical protein
MTICTFDLMVGDMGFMHEGRGIFRVQEGRFLMALETFSFRDMAIPFHDIHMALFTGHSPCNILPVIEVPTSDFDISFGLDVTGGTASDGTGDTFFFSSGSGAVVMADEAVGVMNREV